MRFRILVVGRGRCDWADTAVADYTKRLRRMGGVKEEVVKAASFKGDVHAVRKAEADRLLARVKPRDRLVAMDERGESLDTVGFQTLVNKGRQQGSVVFVIGGAYGLDASVRDRAWRVVRLSSMVMNHQVARVVLYEQLYRAMTLIEGVPYHH